VSVRQQGVLHSAHSAALELLRLAQRSVLGTAAAGAAVGVGLAEATIVETQMEPQAPTSVWEMISQLLDQAQWLSYSLLGLWLMTWIAPPPTQMVAKLRAVLAATRPQPPAE
jgi:hypothetical protein